MLFAAKVVIFLKKDRIIFIFGELKQNTKVLLVEFLLMEFTQNDLFFLGFSESAKEHI